MNILTNIRLFIKELKFLVTSPVFMLLTLLGNSFILFCSYVFYLMEKDINPKMHHFIDAVWWGFATSTTTGYGDITPVSNAGKLLGIFLMLTGLALFSIYTALFADVILTSKKYMNKT